MPQSREEKNRKQREKRQQDGNKHTKKYEKTVKGFLMRLYRNMDSRINGVQKAKHHLYAGKELVGRETFYWWALGSHKFYELFGAYRESGYERKLAPSVDRIDSAKGYSLDNMEWVTMSENSRRGSIAKHAKKDTGDRGYTGPTRDRHDVPAPHRDVHCGEETGCCCPS